MSSFFAFCTERGLIIEHLPMGRWFRTRTVNKPKHRNGSAFFGGTFGHCCNWEVGVTETWFADKESKVDPDMARRMEESRVAHDRRREEDAIRAEQKAAEMIAAATVYEHPYLISKGLPAVKGLVLDQTLLVPMRTLSGRLVGLQTIEMEAGEWKKKMLFGTRARGAVLKLGSTSEIILCEGYATGLSISEALKNGSAGESVLICFSAGNLVHVASLLKSGSVYADNDVSVAGQEAAEKSGLPWVMSEIQGNDANDDFRLGGLTVERNLMKLRRLRQDARQTSKVTSGAVL